MFINDIFSTQASGVGVKVRTKDDLLRETARRAVQLPELGNFSEDDIYSRLKQREDQGGTGIGEGVAVPHARLEKLDAFVFFIIVTETEIEFASPDRRKVRIFPVIFGPENRPDDFLRLLAAVSNTLAYRNIKEKLLAATDENQLREIFLTAVPEREQPSERVKMKLLLIILHQEHFFYDVLQFFLQEGIGDVTVLESSGMDRYVARIPLFAAFFDFINERKHHSRTILAVVADHQLAMVTRGIERITGDLSGSRGAMVVAVDPLFCLGSIKGL